MHILCPQCRNPVELVKLPSHTEIVCPSCGSGFRMEGETTRPLQGQTLGKFELLDTVGTGAFGTVYKARDPELDRVVAIKVPRAGHLAGPQDLDRFLREARSVALLRHPSIVPVHEVGHADNVPYLVSEFVQGVTLGDLLTDRRPTPREAAELIAAVADALQYAHDMGVVHRDVKPANIMLERVEGPGSRVQSVEAGSRGASPLNPEPWTLNPRLMDFGLAKRDVGESTMTIDGQVLGTPAYMSPEQARGESHKVDGRSDLYSLGVVLYQLLTGELPFRGNTRMMLHHVLHDEPRPPRSLNDRIPRDLETICLKAMAKEPRRRYPTAGEFAADLRRWLRDEPIQARPVGRGERLWRWCRRNPVVAALSAAVVLTLVVGMAFSTYFAVDATAKARAEGQAKDKAGREAQRAQQMERVALKRFYASQTNLIHQACVAGDRARALRLLDGLRLKVGDEDLRTFEWYYLWRLCHQGCRGVLNGHEGTVAAVVFLPDGRTLASGSHDGTVRLWDIETKREVHRFPERVACHSLAISPDGRLLAAGRGDGAIIVWELDKRTERLRLAAGAAVRTVTFSPDGGYLASGDDNRRVRIWRVANGAEICSASVKNPVGALAFSTDGKILATADSAIVTLWGWDGRELKSGMHPPFPGSPVAFSPDGRWVANGSLDLRLYSLPAFTGQSLDQSAGAHLAIAFSPDSKYLVAAGSDATASVFDFARRVYVARYPHLGPVHALAFSPDGRVLASGGEDHAIKLWDFLSDPVDSTVPLEPFTNAYAPTNLTFLRDGRTLIAPGKEVTCWDPATRRPRASLPGGLFALSPDEKTLATTVGDGSVLKLWDLASRRELAALEGHKGLIWHAVFSPDGKALVTCEEARSGAVRVGARDVTEGATMIRWDLNTHTGMSLDPGYWVRWTAFAPDGRTMVTGGFQGRVTVWDAGMWQPRFELQRGGASDWVERVAFAPDGRTLVVSENNGLVKLYDVDTWKVRLVLRGHTRWVWGLAFSPDGKTLATGSHDRTIKFWDVETGQERLTLMGHSERVAVLAFSADGKLLASASYDNTVRLWRAAAQENDFGPGD